MAENEGDFVRMCRNLRCKLVCRPDIRIHPKGDEECPRCGTRYEIADDWKVRDGEGIKSGATDER